MDPATEPASGLSMYEYAPAGTEVYYGDITGDVGTDMTLTLTAPLNNFFVLGGDSGETLIVKENVTRDDLMNDRLMGDISCLVTSTGVSIMKLLF